MPARLELRAEFLQLLGIDVADGPEFEAIRVPAPDVESLDFLDLGTAAFRGRVRRDEEIDHMGPAPIDDGGDGPAVDVVQTPADQTEALGSQVDDRRRDVELAGEPWFPGWLVARLYVGEMLALKRAQMRRKRVAEGALVLVGSDDRHDQ